MSDSEEDDIDNLVDGLAALAVEAEAEENPPPRGYRCGVCKEVGHHFINNCPVAEETGQRTPYQGKRRMFGRYQCTECRRMWVSAFSWANTTEDCQVCGIAIYPHQQRPLHKPKGMQNVCDQDKNHIQKLCGKCKQLGYSCVTSTSSSARRQLTEFDNSDSSSA